MSNGTGIADMPVRAGVASNVSELRILLESGESMGAGGSQIKMRRADKDRKWMWWLLGVIGALQLYFVRELLAAFALFALGFLAIAGVVISLYALHRAWALTVDRVAESRHPVMVAVRHRIYGIEELARRPFRRPGSEQPAS